MHPPEQHWNHNIHYLPVLLAALPRGAQRALDVGCGEGTLTRELRRRVASVTGIDRDRETIELAIAAGGPAPIDYICADFMTAALAPASFDFIVCVAALHHMDEEAALRRMASLLTPGGTLALLGIPHRRLPIELPRELAAGAAHRAHSWRRGSWESAAPIAAPRLTYPQLRRLFAATLPQARLRRHLLWRYSLVWTRPRARPG